MPASTLSQFIILTKKNLKTKIIKRPLTFLLEIILPCSIGLILVWARAYISPKPIDEIKFPDFEFKRWPAGLDPVNKSSGEFILFYAPKNNFTDEIIDKSLENLNGNYGRWYNFEEYFLEEVVFEPVFRASEKPQNTTSTNSNESFSESDLQQIQTYIATFIPYSIKTRQFDDFLYGETSKCRPIGQENCVLTNTTLPQRQKWLQEKLIPNIKYWTWGHCKRPYISGYIFEMVKYLSCFDVDGDILSRRLVNSENDIPLDKEDLNKLSILFNSLKLNKKPTSRAIPGLSNTCPNGQSIYTSPNDIPLLANHIKSLRKLQVTKKGFNSISEMRKFFDNEIENGDILVNKLGSVEFEFESSTTDVDDNKNLIYSIRLPSSERNIRYDIFPKFEEEKLFRDIMPVGSYWVTNLLKMPFQFQLPRVVPETSRLSCGGNLPNYYKEGFSMIQDSIDSAFIDMKTANNSENSKNFKNWRKIYSRFPYGKFNLDIYPIILQFFAASLTTLGSLILVLSAVRSIVDEKETKIKEYIKVMGANNSTQWMAWSFHYMIVVGLISYIFSYIYTSRELADFCFRWIFSVEVDFGNDTVAYEEKRSEVKAVLAFSDDDGVGNGTGSSPFTSFTCLFITMFINFYQMVWLSFLFSVFFTNSSNAAGFTGMFHFLSSLIFTTFFTTNYTDIPKPKKILSCIFPTLALNHIWQIISALEGLGLGLKYETIFEKVSGLENDLSVFELWLVMGFWVGCYKVVALYYETWRPGEFGVGKPWWFVFDYFYWKPERAVQSESAEKEEDTPTGFGPTPWVPFCQQSLTDHESSQKSVQIKNLTKTFKTLAGPKTALNNLSLTFSTNQIHSILGHNGAGKTTLISILTGLLSPDHGTAIIDDFDVRFNLDLARRKLGFCPQFNIFFGGLTVEEHLRFFAGMKGVGWWCVGKEVEKVLKILRFEEYRKCYPG